jgi:uncharacterized SAM-binding protein YcdF (DUF218 family)
MSSACRKENIILIWLTAIIIGIFIVFGFGFGTVFLAVLFLYISLWLYVNKISYINPRLVYIRIIKNLMLIAFALWLLTFVIIEGGVIADNKPDSNLNGDYILVLGAGLKGERPSISLRSRLDTAAEFSKLHPDIEVIVSGGQGEGESITEAEAMKRYLIKEGIDENRIIMEEKSTSTKENLIFSKSILDNLQNNAAYKVILITSDFHIFRTKILAKKVGLDISVLPSKTPLATYLNYTVREYFAMIKMYLE